MVVLHAVVEVKKKKRCWGPEEGECTEKDDDDDSDGGMGSYTHTLGTKWKKVAKKEFVFPYHYYYYYYYTRVCIGVTGKTLSEVFEINQPAQILMEFYVLAYIRAPTEGAIQRYNFRLRKSTR